MIPLDLGRVVVDLIAGELARARRAGSLVGPLAEIGPATEIGPGGLAADSLELLGLAGAVHQQFHLAETNVSDYLLQHRRVGDWIEIVRVAWGAWHERVTFRSSGSDGAPKPCTHAWTDLETEIAAHARQWAGRRRIVSFVPSHHIYGFLWTVMLPAALNVPVLDARRLPPAVLRAELGADDLLVATPTLYDYLAQSLPDFPAGLAGVCSTAPLPPALADALLARGLPLTEIYGSSETAGVGARTWPESAFSLLPYWSRQGDDIARHGLARALPDRIEWLDDRRFRVGGRKDEAVQVGGVNVFPGAIAAGIALHPRVRACSVRLMRPEEGSRLKAFVVWDTLPVAPEDEAAFQTWLRARFSPPERPAAITFGPALPRSAWGKLTDW